MLAVEQSLRERVLSQGPIVIGGPCAAENREQVITSAEEAAKRGVPIVRAPLWKPRTRPSPFMGLAGGFPEDLSSINPEVLSLIHEVGDRGRVYATEVLVVAQAAAVVNEVRRVDEKRPVMIWVGSRNYNQVVQMEIGQAVRGDKNVLLGVKNPMWREEGAPWQGAVEYVIHGCQDPEQVILIHRGFQPWNKKATIYRNIPDFKLAAEIKQKTGLPVLADVSHMGGNAELVMKLARRAMRYHHNGVGLDGLMLEIHSNENVEARVTDKEQQLTWIQVDQLLEDLK